VQATTRDEASRTSLELDVANSKQSICSLIRIPTAYQKKTAHQVHRPLASTPQTHASETTASPSRQQAHLPPRDPGDCLSNLHTTPTGLVSAPSWRLPSATLCAQSLIALWQAQTTSCSVSPKQSSSTSPASFCWLNAATQLDGRIAGIAGTRVPCCC
jgi:hypothetical protein